MRYRSYAAGGGTAYPQLRAVVRPDLAALPDAELAEAIGAETGADAAAMEDFLSGLKRIGGAVLQRLPQIGLGFATGGPIGAILGGLAPVGGGQPGPGAAQPMPVAPGRAGAGLAALLANPTLQQAIAQLIMGRAASPTVTTPSGQQVPTEAFVELIREAADQVLAEREALGEGAYGDGEELPDYLAEAEHRYQRSGFRDDPALRAAVLFRLLEPPRYVAPAPPTTTVVTGPPGTVATTTAPAPPAPAPPVPGGEPFVTYAAPALGGTGPTTYGLDAVEAAWAEWAYEQDLDDILGSVDGGR